MNPVTSYERNVENNSTRRQFLPPFYGDYVEESFQTETRVDSNQLTMKTSMRNRKKTPTCGMQQVQNVLPNRNNSFWVSISGYPLEQTQLVHCFFHDIGEILDKCFTDSNLMYLKYALLSDYKLALSYDNQKIGYGADMHVRIKPEGPVEEVACTTTTPCQSVRSSVTVVNEESNAETVSNDCIAPLGKIDMEVQRSMMILKRASKQVPGNTTVVQANSKNNLSFMQWLKQKVSYLFYLY